MAAARLAFPHRAAGVQHEAVRAAAAAVAHAPAADVVQGVLAQAGAAQAVNEEALQADLDGDPVARAAALLGQQPDVKLFSWHNV